MFQHNVSRTVCQLAQWSVGDLPGGRFGRRPGRLPGRQPGDRRDRRALGGAEAPGRPGRAWGLEAELIGPDEVKRLVPFLRVDDLYGALSVPSDCAVKTVPLCEALASRAGERGARFYADDAGDRDRGSGGRVRAVETPRGRIATDIVVPPAGMWGPLIGRMVGVESRSRRFSTSSPGAGRCPSWPARPVDSPALRPLPGPRRLLPPVRRCDRVRLLPARSVIGRARGTAPPGDASRDAGRLPNRLGRRDRTVPVPGARRARRPVQRAVLVYADGNSILGESPDVRGFWAAEAVWVTHAGGVGKVVAEWLVEGRPSIDLREVDLNRFQPHAFGHQYLRARSARGTSRSTTSSTRSSRWSSLGRCG